MTAANINICLFLSVLRSLQKRACLPHILWDTSLPRKKKEKGIFHTHCLLELQFYEHDEATKSPADSGYDITKNFFAS